MNRAVIVFLAAVVLVTALQANAADDSLDTFFPGADKDGRKAWKPVGWVKRSRPNIAVSSNIDGCASLHPSYRLRLG